MNGSSLDPATPSRGTEILGQIGVELAFVEPESDTGLLPINSLVMDFEEFVAPLAPAPIGAATAALRRWLDQILDGSGRFTADSVRQMNAWHGWMTSALLAWERSQPLPTLPEEWNSPRPAASASAPPVASPPPTPAPAPAPTVLPAAAAPSDEPTIQLNLGADAELLHEFHAESLELLQNIEQGVLILEKDPGNAATINSIFRAFHTFKGGAGFLHLDALRNLAHDLESLLDAVRRSELRISSDIIDLILEGGDALKQFTQAIGSQIEGTRAGEPIVVPTRHLIQRVRAALRGDPSP
ncbi:MAG: Hpt domain-containing protein, partial [Verrucomicrobia bacterium]|nr:Hpt domain-containing protein [Verrucomicrobiota bacterium]